jgi:hypothetical protein
VSTSSTIIEEIETMRKSGLASLAIFYHDFREGQKKDLRGLLSSVLFQLCDQSDSYYNVLSISIRPTVMEHKALVTMNLSGV